MSATPSHLDLESGVVGVDKHATRQRRVKLGTSCVSNDIAQFEAAIRQSAGNPNAGLTAPQSIGAQLDRQPTPDSLRKAKERLQSKFSTTMARAKRLDAKGDLAGCTRALSEAKRMYIL